MIENIILRIRYRENYFSVSSNVTETAHFQSHEQALRNAYFIAVILLLTDENLIVLIQDDQKENEVDCLKSDSARILKENNIWLLPQRRAFPSVKNLSINQIHWLLTSKLFNDLPGYSGFIGTLHGAYAEKRVQQIALTHPDVDSVRLSSSFEDEHDKCDLLITLKNKKEIKLQVKSASGKKTWKNIKNKLNRKLQKMNVNLLLAKSSHSDSIIFRRLSEIFTNECSQNESS